MLVVTARLDSPEARKKAKRNADGAQSAGASDSTPGVATFAGKLGAFGADGTVGVSGGGMTGGVI